MEVGSEWTEDPRRGPDHEEEDEDVEMASEGPPVDPTPHNYSSDPGPQQQPGALISSGPGPMWLPVARPCPTLWTGLCRRSTAAVCLRLVEELHVYNASSGVESRFWSWESVNPWKTQLGPASSPLPSAQGTQWDRPNLNSARPWAPWRPQISPLQSNRGLDSEAPLSPHPLPLYTPRERCPALLKPVSSTRVRSTAAAYQHRTSSRTTTAASGVGSLSNMSKLHYPLPQCTPTPWTTKTEASPETSDGDETLQLMITRGAPPWPVSPIPRPPLTEDEASYMEAERSLSALEEGGGDLHGCWRGSETPHSGFTLWHPTLRHDSPTCHSHSTADGCPKSPGIFSLEELPKEDKDQSVIQELTLLSPQLQPGSAEPLCLQLGGAARAWPGDVDAELGDRNDVKPWTQCCLWPPSTQMTPATLLLNYS
ncbi:hypothetical protein DPEC_G00126500 [Dallia pectoralis]|uniref:Uncharacterized protein n=1 Tax=Dallia pectoralis TaxID=75939 RepID=A0ACC2GS52_DALPE|nr:hypothetical protein DPEC_G00126500 [Dallia pectoralis]